MNTRGFLLFAFSLLIAGTAGATPYVVSDPYPGGGGDVIGDTSLFDIDKIKFLQMDPTQIEAEIDLNYDGGALTLPEFTVGGRKLDIGDLLFKKNGQFLYGVPVKDHSSAPNGGAYGSGGQLVTAGALYQINAGGSITAWQALNGAPGDTGYRPMETVWLWKNNGSLTLLSNKPAGTDPVVASLGGSEIKIDLRFIPGGNFYSDLMSGQLSVHFASAICANDVIDGRIAIPEPGTWTMMLGAALLGLGMSRRRVRS
jgi:hypothetical protein